MCIKYISHCQCFVNYKRAWESIKGPLLKFVKINTWFVYITDGLYSTSNNQCMNYSTCKLSRLPDELHILVCSIVMYSIFGLKEKFTNSINLCAGMNDEGYLQTWGLKLCIIQYQSNCINRSQIILKLS